MNEVQKTAMQVEEMKETKPGNENQESMIAEAMRQNQRNILRIITEGLGAIRNGTYGGHDIMAVAELQTFLKRLTNDIQNDIKSKTAPTAEFKQKETVAA